MIIKFNGVWVSLFMLVSMLIYILSEPLGQIIVMGILALVLLAISTEIKINVNKENS